MTPAVRCFPHPSTALDVAVGALAGQGRYGVMTKLARQHEVRRQVVYDLRDQARHVLEQALTKAEAGQEEDSGRRFTLELTEADIARTVIALRVVTPSSIRDEVAMLPIIYGFRWSYGKIQGLLSEAASRASAFLDDVDLAGILHIALDEMFSQGWPVFGGIGLDTQYLFQLEVHEGRSGADWNKALARLRDDNNLHPAVVVKDAGTGLASGVQQTWPGIEERDDLFHGWHRSKTAAFAYSCRESADSPRGRT